MFGWKRKAYLKAGHEDCHRVEGPSGLWFETRTVVGPDGGLTYSLRAGGKSGYGDVVSFSIAPGGTVTGRMQAGANAKEAIIITEDGIKFARQIEPGNWQMFPALSLILGLAERLPKPRKKVTRKAPVVRKTGTRRGKLNKRRKPK